jgi:transcriptional regulator with XRE-family HTH domain
MCQALFEVLGGNWYFWSVKSRPKTNRQPPPRREIEICERLRDARSRLRLTQAEFAAQIEITRPRLASYEECRVPLRFDLALRICRQFIISEKWLATGEGDVRLLMDLATDHSINKIRPDLSFGQAYDEVLGRRYEQAFKEQGGNIRIQIHSGEGMPFIKNLFLLIVERWCSLLNPDEIPAFLMQLINLGIEIVRARVQTGKLPKLMRLDAEEGGTYLAVTEEEKLRVAKTDLAEKSLKGNSAEVKNPRFKNSSKR